MPSADVQAASLAHGLEEVVGKPLALAYYPGQRRDWIEVAFEWASDQVPRHPSWRGLRADKNPDDLRRSRSHWSGRKAVRGRIPVACARGAG